MDPKQSLDTFPLPPAINELTARTWLERHIKARLEKLLTEQWGQKLPRLGVRNENPLFLDARMSVAASFFNDLCGRVIHDVFANRKTIEPHKAYLDSLRSGGFEIQINGKFNDAQRQDLSAVIYELAQTCAGLVETLPLPHTKKPYLDTVPSNGERTKMSVLNTGAATNTSKSLLSERELGELAKLKNRIEAAVKVADLQGIQDLSQKLKDKSRQLGLEIEAISTATPYPDKVHDEFLKRKHQDVILDGLVLANKRKQELSPAPEVTVAEPPAFAPPARSFTPIPLRQMPPIPPRPTSQEPMRKNPLQAATQGFVNGLRRHVAATVLGFAAAITGVAVAVSITGAPPKAPQAPHLSASFHAASSAPAKSTAVQRVLPAVQAASSANSGVITERMTVSEFAAATAPTTTATIASSLPMPTVATKVSLSKERALPAVSTEKPVKVAGVNFNRVTSDTLKNMCDEMRVRNIRTWACEHQPA